MAARTSLPWGRGAENTGALLVSQFHRSVRAFTRKTALKRVLSWCGFECWHDFFCKAAHELAVERRPQREDYLGRPSVDVRPDPVADGVRAVGEDRLCHVLLHDCARAD